MGVVVEPEHPVPKAAREENIQCHAPVATSPDDGNPYFLLETYFLCLNYRLRYSRSDFGLSYLSSSQQRSGLLSGAV